MQKEPTILEELAYRDTWGRGQDSFISMIYERLTLMRDLLASDGTIYVHCDWRVNSYIRLVMDKIFGKNNFRNEVTWRRQIPRGRKIEAKHMAFSADYILIYTKTDSFTWNKINKTSYISVDEAERKYMKDDRWYFRTSDPGSYTNDSLIEIFNKGRIYVTNGGLLLKMAY